MLKKSMQNNFYFKKRYTQHNNYTRFIQFFQYFHSSYKNIQFFFTNIFQYHLLKLLILIDLFPLSNQTYIIYRTQISQFIIQTQQSISQMQYNTNNSSKNQVNNLNSQKSMQFTNQTSRKIFAQEKSTDLKKSSIFFTTPNLSNSKTDPNLQDTFKPKFQLNSLKKADNINIVNSDKKSANINTNTLNVPFDKTLMYSSQIVNTANTANLKKGGLQSMGKFIGGAINQIDNNQKNQVKKSFEPSFNQFKPSQQYHQYKVASYQTAQQKKNQFLNTNNFESIKSNNLNSTYNVNSQSKSYTNLQQNNSFKPFNLNINTKKQIIQDQNLLQTRKSSQLLVKSNSISNNYIPPTNPIGSKQYYVQLANKKTNDNNNGLQKKKFDNNEKKPQLSNFSKKQVVIQNQNPNQHIKNNNNQIKVNDVVNQYGKSNFLKDKSKQISKNTNLKNLLTKDDFHIGKKLGKGQFGQVFIAKHKKTGFICAMKIIKKTTIIEEKVQDQLVRQLKIQFFLHHKNIAALYGFFNDQQNVYLLLQLCSEGQLFDILKQKRRLPQETVSEIIFQICSGLQYIHRQRIIHRDIKPENVIMHLGVAKICDFGWAVYRANGMRTTFCGTPLYTSPQLLRGQQYDQKVDIWAVGILTYELIIGRIPFRIMSQVDMSKILKDDITFPQFVQITDTAKDFILKILKKNPQDRFEVQQLLNHAFLTKRKTSQYTFNIVI